MKVSLDDVSSLKFLKYDYKSSQLFYLLFNVKILTNIWHINILSLGCETLHFNSTNNIILTSARVQDPHQVEQLSYRSCTENNHTNNFRHYFHYMSHLTIYYLGLIIILVSLFYQTRENNLSILKSNFFYLSIFKFVAIFIIPHYFFVLKNGNFDVRKCDILVINVIIHL
jgi:hypothetical protein